MHISKIKNDRRVILSPEQKRKAADLRNLGFTPTEARRAVLTPEQKQEHNRQIHEAARRRYKESPYREIIMRARHLANSACKRGVKHGAHEFTITEHDLDWPTHCPVLGIRLHYPGHYHRDPAGASLDRLDVRKGYLPGNVRVVSLRANLLRKDAKAEELQALANYYLFDPYDPDLD